MKKTILMIVAALFVLIAVNAQTRKITARIRKSGNPAQVIKGKTVPIRKSTTTKVQSSKKTASQKNSYQREEEEANYRYWYERSDEYNINKNIGEYFSKWLKKGEFEKTVDYDKRLNERSKIVFDSICNSVIIYKIEDVWRDIRLGTYNTETEEFPVFVKTPYNFGRCEIIGKAHIKIPIESAQDFRNKFYSGDGTGFNYSKGPVVPRADFVYVSSTENPGDNVLCPTTVVYYNPPFCKDIINIKLTYDEKTKPVKVVFDELGITDKYLNGHVFTFDGYDETIYEKDMVDKMPSPYGYESIEKWIEQDSECQEVIKNEEYRVLVRFVIDKNGRMNMFYCNAGDRLYRLYYSFNSIKKWSPGILNGKRINARVRLCINCKSESKKKNEIKEEQNESESNKIFNGDDVDQKPSFPGGNKALNKFIASNLRYPDMARMLDKQGTIIVKFVVNETGVLTDIKLAKDSYSLSLGKESLRVVKAMPKWYPGQKNGKAAKVKWSIPITFRL